MSLASVLPRHEILPEYSTTEDLYSAEKGWTTLRAQRFLTIPPAQVIGKYANSLGPDNPIQRTRFRIPPLTLSKYSKIRFIPGQFILCDDKTISGDSCEEPVYQRDQIWFHPSHTFNFRGEKACFPRLASYKHWAGHNNVDIAPLLDRPVRQIAGPVFSLAAWYHNNVCHWLLDFLCRYWGRSFVKDSGLRFLVPESDLPFISESLDLLGINREDLILYNNHTVLEIETLYSTSRLTSQYNYVSPEASHFYNFLPNLVPNYKTGDHPLVYISRKDSKRRPCVNEAEFEEALKALGFHIAELTSLTIPERIQLFQGCQFLLGACGAGMSHSILLPNGSSVCATGSPEMHHHSNFLLNIAATKQQTVSLIPGVNIDNKNPVTDRWELDIENSIENVKRLIDRQV